MNHKLELLAKEIERHIAQDGCACCRTKEYLATIKEILDPTATNPQTPELT